MINRERCFYCPTPVAPHKGKYEKVGDHQWISQATPRSIRSRWVPAASSNYTAANRESDGNSIDYVIIHTTQGSYSGAIGWFQNPASNVSAHYVIRSSDGEITQMVQNKDIAWHTGNWNYNVHSIGIEHEGYVSDPAWYTDHVSRIRQSDPMVVRLRYGIPKNRNHIIAHSEVPGATHTDPGPHWDWNYYMSLINQSEELVFDNAGPHMASDAWGTSTWNSQKYGSNYVLPNRFWPAILSGIKSLSPNPETMMFRDGGRPTAAITPEPPSSSRPRPDIKRFMSTNKSTAASGTTWAVSTCHRAPIISSAYPDGHPVPAMLGGAFKLIKQ